MSGRQLPRLPPGALRDYTAEPHLDELWSRIDDDLPLLATAPRKSALSWAPAAGAWVLTFGLGVLVGTHWLSPEPQPARVLATAEIPPALEVRPGAEPGPPPQILEVPASVAHSAPAQAGQLRAPTLAGRKATRGPGATEPAAATATQTPPWQQLASKGDYAAGLAALKSAGGWQQVLHASSAEELMTLAEMARGVGAHIWELRALKRVVEHHRGDPNAEVAAWMLVRRLKKAGDKAGAARYLEEYRRLSPDGDFAEDALAAEALSAAEQGDAHRASKFASQYEQKFPQGRWLAQLRAALAKLGSAPEHTANAPAANGTTPGDAGAQRSTAEQPPSPKAPDTSPRGRAARRAPESPSAGGSPSHD